MRCFVFLFLFLGSVSASPIAQGPYLGQTPPGLTPKVFAPGLICQSDDKETHATFSADGNLFCFRNSSGIHITEQTEEGWTPLERISVIPSGRCACPAGPPDSTR